MVEGLRIEKMQLKEHPQERDKALIEAGLTVRLANPLGPNSSVSVEKVSSKQKETEADRRRQKETERDTLLVFI